MLINHSREILLNRLALAEAKSLEARPLLIARIVGEQLNAQAIEKLDAPEPLPSTRLDKRA